MADLVNKDFTQISVDGDSYLPWAIEIKILLIAKGFIDDFNEPNPQARVSDQPNITHYFLRHHVFIDLKNDGR